MKFFRTASQKVYGVWYMVYGKKPIYFRQYTTNERGIAHLVLIVLGVLGTAIALYLVGTRTNYLPSAQQDERPPAQTAFHLFVNQNYRIINNDGKEVLLYESHTGRAMEGMLPKRNWFYPGEEIRVNVAVSSDVDLANNFAAIVAYPSELLEATSIMRNNESVSLKHDKIGSVLIELYNKKIAGEVGIEEWAKGRGLRLQNGKVQVTLTVDLKLMKASGLDLGSYGFETSGKYENLIDGYLPIENLLKLAELKEVTYIQVVYPPSTNTTTLTDEQAMRLNISEQSVANGSTQGVGVGCKVSGCSGQLCLNSTDEAGVSTCVWKEEYACYKSAKCEKQSNGQCGWTQTAELTSCLGGGGGVCPKIATTACKYEQVTCVRAPCPPQQICKEYASPCDVPEGWEIQDPNLIGQRRCSMEMTCPNGYYCKDLASCNESGGCTNVWGGNCYPNPTSSPSPMDCRLVDCAPRPVPSGCKLIPDGSCCGGTVSCEENWQACKTDADCKDGKTCQPNSVRCDDQNPNSICHAAKICQNPIVKPSCRPRPACLDSEPRCLLPETEDMCPPAPKSVPDYFIQKWSPETGIKADSGKVLLSGSVSAPGIRTTSPLKPIMATIVFKAKKAGEAQLTFTDGSVIARSSDGVNILGNRNGLNIVIKDSDVIPVEGDLNDDGEVNLKDFSILLSKWGTDDKKADLNHDGKVNIYDFSKLISKWSKGNSLIRKCPEHWIANQMPSVAESGNDSSPNEYYVLEGQRREITDFDRKWVMVNCNLVRENVY